MFRTLFSLTPVYTCDGRPLECCLDHNMARKRESNTENMTTQQLEVSLESWIILVERVNVISFKRLSAENATARVTWTSTPRLRSASQSR